MTLKQLLGILLVPCIACAMAVAGPQLTQVSVDNEGGATNVTLHATGPFTHTEYRPSDNLLLVDLAGVSAAKMDGKSHPLNGPNVVSYRVLSYQSSDGADVSRVEIGLAAGAQVKLSDGADQVNVQITGTNHGMAAPVVAKKAVHAAPAGAAKTATIEKLAMVRGRDGMELEIVSSAPVSPSATKLTAPDRLVLDIPNAKSLAPKKEIAVNAESIKGVRMARYQNEPPVTRIVVDLAENRDYELVPRGNRLLVKFHAAAAQSAPSPVVATIAAAPAPAAETAAPKADAGPAKAAEFAVVTPELHSVAPKESAAQVASNAASKFSGDKSDTVFNVGPGSSASLQPTNVNFQIQPQAAAAAPAGTSARPKYTGEPISVNLKDVDLKDFFRLIHEISGLNVVLDPNVHGTLTIVLDDVPWDQALDIVLKNNGLDRQLEGNVLRIATVETLRKEAEARRGQIEAQALAVDKVTVTRFLSYAHSKDVVATVKKFLSSRGDVVSDDRTNALIIDDIPNTIPKIDELLAKLDRKTPEVEIEARVVAATRNFAREIGTQLGFGWGNNATAVNGAPAAGNSPLTPGYVNPPPYFTSPGVKASPPPAAGQVASTTPASIPLFSNLAATAATSGATLFNIGRDYRLDLLLTMAESRGLIKILSRPRVVTQNNIQALVRQGVRVPITTQAQLGGPPTVTYVDAFLRLTVTPQITAESTIFLNVDVENTTPDFSHEIQGNPTLLTQQATTQVLVTDGGTVVIGGVIQTTNSVAIAQVPLLGNIPIFGELFKHRTVSTQTQELIFFITPRIIQT